MKSNNYKARLNLSTYETYNSQRRLSTKILEEFDRDYSTESKVTDDKIYYNKDFDRKLSGDYNYELRLFLNKRNG